jgi:hypothetical protein
MLGSGVKLPNHPFRKVNVHATDPHIRVMNLRTIEVKIIHDVLFALVEDSVEFFSTDFLFCRYSKPPLLLETFLQK